MATAAIPDIGLRHIAFVRIHLDDDGVHAEVVGQGHRLPRVVPISLTMANRLAASGVPVVGPVTEAV